MKWKLIRWRMVLIFARLLRVSILADPVFFGAQPVATGQELIDGLRDFFSDDPKPTPRHLKLVK